MTVLPRPEGQPDAAVLDDQVAIRWRHEDLPRHQRLPVCGRAAPKPTGPLEDSRQGARAAGSDMQDDADGRRQVGGQSRNDPLERLDASCRGADHYEITLVAEPFENVG